MKKSRALIGGVSFQVLSLKADQSEDFSTSFWMFTLIFSLVDRGKDMLTSRE